MSDPLFGATPRTVQHRGSPQFHFLLPPTTYPHPSPSPSLLGMPMSVVTIILSLELPATRCRPPCRGQFAFAPDWATPPGKPSHDRFFMIGTQIRFPICSPSWLLNQLKLSPYKSRSRVYSSRGPWVNLSHSATDAHRQYTHSSPT